MATKLLCATEGCRFTAAKGSNYCAGHQDDEPVEVYRASREDDDCAELDSCEELHDEDDAIRPIPFEGL